MSYRNEINNPVLDFKDRIYIVSKVVLGYNEKKVKEKQNGTKMYIL